METWKLSAIFSTTLALGTLLYFFLARDELATYSARKLEMKVDPITDELQKKLWKSEKTWERRYRLLKKQDKELLGNYSTINLKKLWNYFPASFQCPYEVQRIGTDGDGGKYVCGFSVLKNLSECLVYSFGINNEVSFEKMILEQTNCTVRMHDIIKIKPNPAALLKYFPGRVTYSETGINAQNNSLKSIMDKNGDSFIHILKMDIEGI